MNTDHLALSPSVIPELDLRPAYREILRRLLAAHVPHVEVWAYGSRINGSSHDGSDLDLVLRAPDHSPIEPGRFPALKIALEESELPILVDVLDWARLPKTFQREIERVHVVVQRAKTGSVPDDV